MVTHVHSAFLRRGPPPYAVVYVHHAVLEHRWEAIVVLIAPCHTVEDVHALVGVVLVEALVQVLKGHAVGHHVGTRRLVEGSTSGRASASQLETVAVLALRAVLLVAGMPRPAVVDNHGVVDHVEVPVVVGVCPCAASVELSARTGEQLACKAVGVAMVVGAAVSHCVVVLIRVAVDYLVIAAVGIAGVELWLPADWERLGFLNGEIFEHAYLQACVVVPAEHAALYNIVGAFYLHAVVLGVLKRQPVESPVVGKVVHIYATRLLEGNL